MLLLKQWLVLLTGTLLTSFLTSCGIKWGDGILENLDLDAAEEAQSGQPNAISAPEAIQSDIDQVFEETDQAFIQQVNNQLIAIGEQAELDGYQLTHDPYLGRLAENEIESISIELDGGVAYALVGVCDNDCSDVDLYLYDENNYLIDEDIEMDDFPLIEVTPQWQGPFTVVVEMPRCSAEYCYYGVGAFGQ